MWLLDQLRQVKRWCQYIYLHKDKVEIGRNIKIPFFTKLKYNLRGFTDEDYYNFDLKNNDYSNYISYWERLKLENINGRFASVLSEKVMFERIWGSYVRVPHVFCWIMNKKCIDLDKGNEVDLLEIIRSSGKIIAKPTRSVGGGTGIHLLEYNLGDFYLDGIQIDEEKLMKEIVSYDEYIFVQYIESAPYSLKIFPDATNTIRIVTTMNRENNEVEVLLAFHRFGTETSKPVDNISSGGMFALVNEDTGQLGKAKRKTEPHVEYENHPDTGATINGVMIPNWNLILSELKKAHHCFPYYNFLAWDVAINENEDAYILEINRGCDLTIQSIKPMRNEKLGRYMKENGLLDL